MPNVISGPIDSVSGRFAIVVSRYNDSITGKLLSGAVDTLTQHGVQDSQIDVAWVPGAWEIPLVAQRFAQSEDYVAVLCLGAVIRGETTHDEHINRQVSLSLGQIALDTGVPVLFGVLTCNNLEQAIHRSGGNVGNKGVECALAALEMASLLSKLPCIRAGQVFQSCPILFSIASSQTVYETGLENLSYTNFVSITHAILTLKIHVTSKQSPRSRFADPLRGRSQPVPEAV